MPGFRIMGLENYFRRDLHQLAFVRNHIHRTLRSNADTADTGMLVHQQRFFGHDLLSPLTSSRSSICPRSAPTSNFALPLREHHPVELRFCMSAMPGGVPVGQRIWAGLGAGCACAPTEAEIIARLANPTPIINGRFLCEAALILPRAKTNRPSG